MQNFKKNNLKIVFMGTSDLSEVILQSLIDEKYNIVGVFTKPDTKVGRKQEIVSPLVKKLAEKNKLPVFQPIKFNIDTIEILRKLQPDLVIVAAYGKIIPKLALEIPAFGFINVHVSLLPKYRGPSPIQNALLNGEKETGITIMQMDEGIDTGNILTQEKVNINQNDTTEILMQKLSIIGANLLLKIIPLWVEGKIKSIPQNHTDASFCKMITREDGKIFWSDTAENIFNKFRAMTSWPGIFTFWQNSLGFIRLKLISIETQKNILDKKYQVGEVFKLNDTSNNIAVQTSDGIIVLKKIQKEGKKEATIKEFLNGHQGFIGSILK